jgi:hypothetical protein
MACLGILWPETIRQMDGAPAQEFRVLLSDLPRRGLN